MSGSNLQQLHDALALTSVFIGVTKTPLLRAFSAYCQADVTQKRRAYADFVAEIYEGGGDLTALLQKLLFEDENVYIKAVATKRELPTCIAQSAERELYAFSLLGSLTAEDFAADMGAPLQTLPAFVSKPLHMHAAYAKRLTQIDKYGYGIFSSNGMFRLLDDGSIQPIVSADKTSLSGFIGYESEREKVVANTRAFVEGRSAANALLCGDAGTGKSSTVKAVANAFFDEGLRLIELRKDQLGMLPQVMASISGNPLKFILFIDDLSFRRSDDDFSMLKAALEGSASAKADNAVIYATSNRRHIIKESFSEREGDDVHRNDTLQEKLSLSERFGLVVLFSKPDKALYLKIVHELAKRRGIPVDTQLDVEAEAFALRKGNRSARGAEQFIQSLL